MASISPSSSYVRFLALSQKPAPKHIQNILPGYKITHILGSGGFANVYRAVGLHGKEVALKIPKTDDIMATMDMSVIEKFKTESDIWTKLEHENIVEIYASDTQPLPHIAMELMGGGSLNTLMKNHRLTVGEAVHIMLEILKGLSYSHRMATVHRDLKPENILFTSDGVAKISDWGIGKYMASTAMSKTIGTKGTLNYCAPEQYDKRKYGKVDWQTDIFQIGTLFYEMLTGRNPFAGEDMADCMGMVLTYNPKPPSALNLDISSELDDVVMGALEKKKEYRWESGGIMLHELKGVVGDRRGEKRKEEGRRDTKTATVPQEITNSIGMKFVKIPEKDYYMGKYTVTQMEWKKVMGITPWKYKNFVCEGDYYPATNISWNNCQEFITRLNEIEGVNKYRLPTEAEWEHACRAGNISKYGLGDEKKRLDQYAWYHDIGYDKYGNNPKMVGQKKANKWNLYDMHGNIMEWCLDKYGNSGNNRILKGGDWYSQSERCSASFRDACSANLHSSSIGFRIIYDNNLKIHEDSGL